MGPYKEVWSAHQAEMCPFQIPELEPVFMSRASACQVWASCLAVAQRLGQKMCSYISTMFHMGALYRHKVGNYRARIWLEFLHGPKLVLCVSGSEKVLDIASEEV